MSDHRAMWKNFLQSMALLAIAMMAALYSASMGREPDQARSAVIAAIFALAVAVWVAWRFVPRLARSVDWEWLPFISQYKVTQDGWIYFGALTIVVFAAINTSNNLLYMVLAALLAVLLLSGFLSALNFRFVEAVLRIPSRCFAGETFPFSLQLYNHKHMFPAFSLQIEPIEDSPIRFRDFYFPAIPPQKPVVQSGEAAFPRRGRYVIGKVRATSRYPFGFLSKGRNCDVDAECICYPKIIPQEKLSLTVLDILGSHERFERGLGNDLYTIRDYVPSDSARHVHWKASAKTSTLKTREYAAEDSQRIVLAFDRFGRSGDSEQFEQLVSYTASLAFHLTHSGIEVALVSDDWKSTGGSSPVVLDSILNYLALVDMDASSVPPTSDPVAGALLLSVRR